MPALHRLPRLPRTLAVTALAVLCATSAQARVTVCQSIR